MDNDAKTAKATGALAQYSWEPGVHWTTTAVKIETPHGDVKVRHREGKPPDGTTWGDLAGPGFRCILAAIQELLETVEGISFAAPGLALLFRDVATSTNPDLLAVLERHEIKVEVLDEPREDVLAPVACINNGYEIEKGDVVALCHPDQKYVHRIDPADKDAEVFGVAQHDAVAEAPVLVLTHLKELVPSCK